MASTNTLQVRSVLKTARSFKIDKMNIPHIRTDSGQRPSVLLENLDMGLSSLWSNNRVIGPLKILSIYVFLEVDHGKETGFRFLNNETFRVDMGLWNSKYRNQLQTGRLNIPFCCDYLNRNMMKVNSIYEDKKKFVYRYSIVVDLIGSENNTPGCYVLTAFKMKYKQSGERQPDFFIDKKTAEISLPVVVFPKQNDSSPSRDHVSVSGDIPNWVSTDLYTFRNGKRLPIPVHLPLPNRSPFMENRICHDKLLIVHDPKSSRKIPKKSKDGPKRRKKKKKKKKKKPKPKPKKKPKRKPAPSAPGRKRRRLRKEVPPPPLPPRFRLPPHVRQQLHRYPYPYPYPRPGPPPSLSSSQKVERKRKRGALQTQNVRPVKKRKMLYSEQELPSPEMFGLEPLNIVPTTTNNHQNQNENQELPSPLPLPSPLFQETVFGEREGEKRDEIGYTFSENNSSDTGNYNYNFSANFSTPNPTPNQYQNQVTNFGHSRNGVFHVPGPANRRRRNRKKLVVVPPPRRFYGGLTPGSGYGSGYGSSISPSPLSATTSPMLSTNSPQPSPMFQESPMYLEDGQTDQRSGLDEDTRTVDDYFAELEAAIAVKESPSDTPSDTSSDRPKTPEEEEEMEEEEEGNLMNTDNYGKMVYEYSFTRDADPPPGEFVDIGATRVRKGFDQVGNVNGRNEEHFSMTYF